MAQLPRLERFWTSVDRLHLERMGRTPVYGHDQGRGIFCGAAVDRYRANGCGRRQLRRLSRELSARARASLQDARLTRRGLQLVHAVCERLWRGEEALPRILGRLRALRAQLPTHERG